MVDHNLLVRELLASKTSVTNLLGPFGVMAGQLPEKADPELGPIVVVCKEGGTAFENAPVKTARLKVRVWAGVNQYLLANQVYAAVFDALHGINAVQLTDGFIMWCMEEIAGQDVTDPETGWATVLSYYRITAR